jgi:hypothetical protein
MDMSEGHCPLFVYLKYIMEGNNYGQKGSSRLDYYCAVRGNTFDDSDSAVCIGGRRHGRTDRRAATC